MKIGYDFRRRPPCRCVGARHHQPRTPSEAARSLRHPDGESSPIGLRRRSTPPIEFWRVRMRRRQGCNCPSPGGRPHAMLPAGASIGLLPSMRCGRAARRAGGRPAFGGWGRSVPHDRADVGRRHWPETEQGAASARSRPSPACRSQAGRVGRRFPTRRGRKSEGFRPVIREITRRRGTIAGRTVTIRVRS